MYEQLQRKGAQTQASVSCEGGSATAISGSSREKLFPDRLPSLWAPRLPVIVVAVLILVRPVGVHGGALVVQGPIPAVPERARRCDDVLPRCECGFAPRR